MRKSIDARGCEIIIDCNEVINLFLHTLNIYGLLGNHGNQYKLRQDERVISSIDEKIYDDVQQGDSYFSYGNLAIYLPGMRYIMDNQTWKSPVSPSNIHMGVQQMNFGAAFQKCWEEFYFDYWHGGYAAREKLFHECIATFDFAEAAKKMSIAAHSDFSSDVYIFPAEALAESGLKFSDNVCMGDLAVGQDMGFVHEGLHLLLQEKWARNEEIIKAISASNYKGVNYGSWAAEYEQILVVGLDCCIRNLQDEWARRYYQGCGVGDAFDTAYPLIKEYYNGGCKEAVESLMLRIIVNLL